MTSAAAAPRLSASVRLWLAFASLLLALETAARTEPCTCITLYDPVCDTKASKTYSNSCVAACAGATNLEAGTCADITACEAACPTLKDPVCVISDGATDSAKHRTRAYTNRCVAACHTSNAVLGLYLGSCVAAADNACAAGVSAASAVCGTSGREYPSTCYIKQLGAAVGDTARGSYPGPCQQKEALLLAARCADTTSVQCLVDPCAGAICGSDASAKCVAKYCPSFFRSTYLPGECQAVFINVAGEIATCASLE